MATETETVEHAEDAAGENMAPLMIERDGLYLVGTLVGFRTLNPREIKPGQFVTNVDIGVRVGGTIETAQAGSMEFAREAVPGAVVGDRVAVLVVNRTGAKNGRPWQFYTVARSGGSAAFAAEFGD